MAYERNPIYYFDDEASLGIDKVPNELIIFVKSTSKMYKKLNNTNLSASSTIANALSNTNIEEAVKTNTSGSSNSLFENSMFDGK